jgi:putative N6-adenine-specific DNA methylase
MCKFFVVALPGLEDVVAAEIRDWFPDLETEIEHGGVNVSASLEIGLGMNLVLKTATRVLLRVAEFRCRDFPALYKKVVGIEWSDWVDPACELEVHASTRLSRLKIKRRIEETCEDAWLDYRSKTGAKAARGRKLGLYVRFVNDQCTLSLDTSGERLHKRGLRQWVGEAPLRESLAATLLQVVERLDGAAGGPVEIFDPMVGSGTFLLEAAIRARVISGSREFVGFREPAAVPVYAGPVVDVSGLVGFDQDAKTLKAARENLKGLEVVLRKADVFTAEPLPAGIRRWVFVNPPYGERLKVKEPLGEYYARLFAAVERVAAPERACFLLPARAVKGKFVLPAGWRVLAKRPFVNGGIPVVAFVFGRGGA